jgi:hypothetical protein
MKGNQNSQTIPKAWLEFLKVFSRKQHADFPYLPEEIRRLIIDFLRPAHGFYV